MKKKVSLLLNSILVIIVCLLYINVNAETEILYGDTNGDGGVDGRDATMVQEYLGGIQELDYNAQIRADVDRDHRITANDAILIQANVAKVLDLPVIMGDVNDDGVVDTKDATQIQEVVAITRTFTTKQNYIADVTVDGGVDGRDATQIQRYVAGTTTTLLSVEGKEIVAPNEQSGSTEPEVDPKEDSDQVVNVENTALKVPLVILTISFSLIIAGIVTTSVALLRKEEQKK